jgi:hypothetical protein
MRPSLFFVALVASSVTGAPLTKRIAQVISDSTQKWEAACRAAGGGLQCNPLSVTAFTTLLAAAGPCDQQNAGDSMIDLARQLKNDPTMIKLTQIFVQQPRNTPSSLSVPYCQQAPKNPELNGLFQCQFQGANPTTFVGNVAVGGPGTIPFGQSTALKPPGSCPAHPSGPIADGTQLVDITQDPGVGGGKAPASDPTTTTPTADPTSTSTDPSATSTSTDTSAASADPTMTAADPSVTDAPDDSADPDDCTQDGSTVTDDPYDTACPTATDDGSDPSDPTSTDTSFPTPTDTADPTETSVPTSTDTGTSVPTPTVAVVSTSAAGAAPSTAPVAPPACLAKQKRALNPINALLTKRIAQPDLPAVAQSWQDLCLVSGGDIKTNDPCVKLAGLNGINSLLAGADPCAQQDNADAMIDFANSPGIKNKDALIANAVAYRKHPRNALDLGGGLIPSTPFCTRAPKNAALAQLVNGQLDGVNPGLFGGPKFPVVAFGAPGTCPFGLEPDVSTCTCS